ncbi:MAG TPA: helix-hairpin-helix domain-containing protein, partial [Minicystis sp.]|nr:helix-hairpin-helix domain-containing protein [Minicystis sp.]
MQRPDQAAIASVLRDVAAGLELLGDNRYRVQAYRRGANALEQIQGDLDRLIAEGRLVETPGIGESLAALVAEVRATGRARALDDVAAKLPEGAIPIARAAGLRLRAIRTLAETLGVASVDELRAACAAGRVRSLPGFGERTEQKLLETLERGGKRGLEAEAGTRLDEALELGDDVARRLRSAPGVDAAELVGAARRGVEVVDE